MKANLLKIFIMIMITINLAMALLLFYNGGMMIDALATSAQEYMGGDFWIYFAWLNLLLLFITFVLSLTSLLMKND